MFVTKRQRIGAVAMAALGVHALLYLELFGWSWNSVGLSLWLVPAALLYWMVVIPILKAVFKFIEQGK